MYQKNRQLSSNSAQETYKKKATQKRDNPAIFSFLAYLQQHGLEVNRTPVNGVPMHVIRAA